MSRFINNNIDFWGFLASSLCALHCAAIPLILLFGSLGSFSWLANHNVELGFIRNFSCYWRTHRCLCTLCKLAIITKL